MELDNLLVWTEIDLDAIAFNAASLKRHIGSHSELMVSIKANAYGHGMVEVARAALEGGATWLAVHRPQEGIELRQASINAPIILLGYTLPAEAEDVVRWRLIPTINSRPQAEALSAAALALREEMRTGTSPEADRRGRPCPFHLNVDTGMGRYGLLPDEVSPFLRFLDELPDLALQGLYTHHSTADQADKSFTRHQFQLFEQVVHQLEAEGRDIRFKHVANSATALDLPGMALDMVRCGIALYGLHPSDKVEPAIELLAALEFKSKVTRVRTLPSGASISYGRTFITERPTTVALIPVGYGDGYHRLLSGRGAVLIRGKRAPIVGRICMDQFVVDVTGIQDVQLHDEVVLIGRQGSEEIPAEEVARWAETINYEVTSSLLPRVLRIYFRGGKVVDTSAT